LIACGSIACRLIAWDQLPVDAPGFGLFLFGAGVLLLAGAADLLAGTADLLVGAADLPSLPWGAGFGLLWLG
jgi:hypothetical protein